MADLDAVIDGEFRAEALLALREENHRLRIELEVAQGALKIATLYMLNAQAEAEGLRPQPVSAMTRGDVLHRALRAGA